MDRSNSPGSDRGDLYKRGVRLYLRGHYREAFAELDGAAGTEAKDPAGNATAHMARYYRGMSLRALGLADLENGRFEQAERNLRAAIKEIGADAELGAYLAKVYAKTGRYGQCIAEMERVAEQRPRCAAARRKLAQTQWHAGQRPEAYMTLGAAIREFANDAELHLQMGLFHAAEDRFDDARASLARAARAECDHGDAHYYLGLTSAALEDFPAAVDALQRAVELDAGNLQWAYQLALAARAAGRTGVRVVVHAPAPAAATETSHGRQLARYVATDVEFIDALTTLPESEADEKLFSLLLSVLKMALADHPDYADLHVRCSRILTRLGRIAPAVEHAERAVTINPNYVQAHLDLADLCARMDRPVEAIEHLRRAMARGANWPDVHCRTGELMVRCNAPDGAERHFRQALQLKPDYPRAAEALANLAA